jgi:putative transposase
MPRFARVAIPEIPYHITQRGNARRDVFYSDTDRRTYIGLLKFYALKHDLSILGFCLMTNHIHLVVVPAHDKSMAKTMREVNGRYAQYRNALEHNTGYVWQNRYYSCPFDPCRLGSVMAYVERNPVRAHMADAPDEYLRSSARAHLGHPDPFGLLDLGLWKSYWDPAQWRAQLRLDDPAQDAELRVATSRGRPWGADEFIDYLERTTKRPLRAKPAGRPRREAEIA